MQDFPPNSAKARARSEGPPSAERSERIERITSAEAERRRRGLGTKFKGVFIGGTARGAWDYMLVDVVIPAIQDTIIEAFQGGVERLVKGDSRRSRRYGYGYPSSPYPDNRPHVDYRGYGMNRPPTSATTTRTISRRSRARQDFDDIVIASRSEAHDVLDRMFDFLSQYGVVKVAELYEMVGIRSEHTDHKWGWTSLSGARVARLSDGRFMLDLPEPEELRV